MLAPPRRDYLAVTQLLDIAVDVLGAGGSMWPRMPSTQTQLCLMSLPSCLSTGFPPALCGCRGPDLLTLPASSARCLAGPEARQRVRDADDWGPPSVRRRLPHLRVYCNWCHPAHTDTHPTLPYTHNTHPVLGRFLIGDMGSARIMGPSARAKSNEGAQFYKAPEMTAVSVSLSIACRLPCRPHPLPYVLPRCGPLGRHRRRGMIPTRITQLPWTCTPSGS